MRAALLFAFGMSAAVSLSTSLEPWFQGWAGSRTKSADLLTVVLGDSRRLFAKHIYAKADAYFHRGYYPSIFDTRPHTEEMHMAANTAAAAAESHEEPAPHDKPHDWLEAFSRHFYPSQHSHLGEGNDSCCDHNDHAQREACNHEHDEHCANTSSGSGGEQRELLPWLKLAATLDPEMPETYVVASFWLRNQLGRIDEAEQFLREGLRSNPRNPEMLFELGRIFL